MTVEETQDPIERLLEKPYCLIDILPYQVPADAKGQYFSIEQYFLQPEERMRLAKKFARLVLRLNCYAEIVTVCLPDDTSTRNAAPAQLEAWVKACVSAEQTDIQTIYFLIPEADAMIALCQDDTYMTLYNPNAHLRQLVAQLAMAEGLFVWDQQDI